MKDVKKIAAFVGKILLAVFAFLTFLCMDFWIGIYYLGALTYEHHSEGVVHQIFGFFVVSASVLAILTAITVFLFKKGSKKVIKTVAAALLTVCIPLCAYGSWVSFAACYILGPNGCTYTEDIAHYEEYTRYHFPESITDDMTVKSFRYYFKYIDTYQTDLYLEVTFNDAATMKQYVAAATAVLDEMDEKGTVSFPNPYNASYTDTGTHGRIEFRSTGNYRYVEMHYLCISYSYEDLTLIYSYTDIGSDIEMGNDPDRGEYYPKYLERFGVEWDPDNSFQARLATK